MKTAIIYYSRHHGNTRKLLDEYGCPGFNTFGPFKLIGGMAKSHPTADEFKAAAFYRGLKLQSTAPQPCSAGRAVL